MKTSCKRCKRWFLKEDMTIFNNFYFCSKCEIRRVKMQPFVDAVFGEEKVEINKKIKH